MFNRNSRVTKDEQKHRSQTSQRSEIETVMKNGTEPSTRNVTSNRNKLENRKWAKQETYC